ncbi:magnesium transporter [Pseudoalteromonas tunicata]|uniref:Putative Magnesium transporter n=1 Tax=Pseudoalteromonas tunicata D2 TaxID=87626 RepID=A4CE63_9GAMM|nr:magnesium transporter [Pseudoalteromonas tunicata]ATC93089.1 magnesium transporter [Pseudoalteromonas tunicata]AXT32163.1 magnesium transporter [Pseudoalteromonas tunicata]EAR26875.1 putative Magnesium transporter [Pseudoalteromonas tunicata D2]
MIEYPIDKLPELINELILCDTTTRKNKLLLDAQQNLSTEHLSLLFEAIPKDLRMDIWELLDDDTQHEIFVNLGDDSCRWLLHTLEDEACFKLLEEVNVAELLELEEVIPQRFIDYAKKQLDEAQTKQYELAQQYSQDKLGHWLGFDFLKVSEKLTIAGAKKLLLKGLPQFTEVIYLVTRQGRLMGEVAVNDLLKAQDQDSLLALANHDIVSLAAEDDLYEAAEVVIHSGNMATPIVNADNRLIGRLTIAAAYELRQENIDSAAVNAGGLSKDEDLFASVRKSAKNRGIWLGINLVTAFLASWFIGLFGATIEQVVALAVLMPVVASMGGIAGSQTLTVIVRGLALGQVTDANRNALLKKELRVGALNGLVWSLVIGAITYLWFNDGMLSLTITVAILLNLVAASLSGVWIPWVLDRLKIDPALSGSVILTTVTDIVGFVTFLGLGSLLLL